MELDDERAALNREKLTLAAQVITRDPWIEPQAEPDPIEPDPVLLEPEPWDTDAWEEALYEQAPRRHRALWWLVGLLLVFSAIGTAGFLLGVPPEMPGLVPDLAGVL